MQITRIHEDQQVAADPLLSEFLDAKAAHDHADRRLKQAQAALVARMAEKHMKSTSWEVDGVRKTVTYVQAERVEIDEKSLRRALTAKIFDKYTVKKLDKKAMEAAMETGEIDPMIVAQHVKPVPGNPYLRYSERMAEE